MKAKIKNLRSIRLEFAVILASEPDGDHEVKQAVLKELCKDSVIREVLETYGWKLHSQHRRLTDREIYDLYKQCVAIPNSKRLKDMET